MDTIVNGASANFFGNEEDTLRELTDTLDDGTLILYRRLFSYKVYKFEVRLRTIAVSYTHLSMYW